MSGTVLPELSNPAGAAQILSGYQTIGADGNVITGNIPSQGAQTVTPGTTSKTIAAGRYLSGTQTIAGDVNLVPGNIRQGASIFGVNGTYGGAEPEYVELTRGDFTSGQQNGTGYYYVKFTLPKSCKKLIAATIMGSGGIEGHTLYVMYPGHSYRDASGTLEGATYVEASVGGYQELAVEITGDEVMFVESPDFMSEGNCRELYESNDWAGSCYYISE